MVIDDLGIVGVFVHEAEAGVSPIIDSGTVRAPTVAPQRLEPIPGPRPQKVEHRGGVRLRGLALGNLLEADEASHPIVVGGRLGALATEVPDHFARRIGY